MSAIDAGAIAALAAAGCSRPRYAEDLTLAWCVDPRA